MFHSTAVATVSWSTVESTMRVLCSYWMLSSPCHSGIRVPSKYLNCTPTCCSLRGTALYEAHVASQKESRYVDLHLTHTWHMQRWQHGWKSKALYYLHVQILPADYIGLILCSTAVATASWRVLSGYSDATVTKATVHAVAAEYPHSILNGTLTGSSNSCTVLYETHISSQEESGCVYYYAIVKCYI